jgi:hypothetical protein
MLCSVLTNTLCVHCRCPQNKVKASSLVRTNEEAITKAIDSALALQTLRSPASHTTGGITGAAEEDLGEEL